MPRGRKRKLPDDFVGEPWITDGDHSDSDHVPDDFNPRDVVRVVHVQDHHPERQDHQVQDPPHDFERPEIQQEDNENLEVAGENEDEDEAVDDIDMDMDVDIDTESDTVHTENGNVFVIFKIKMFVVFF